jgi:hypothetical protein
MAAPLWESLFNRKANGLRAASRLGWTRSPLG